MIILFLKSAHITYINIYPIIEQYLSYTRVNYYQVDS